MDIRFTWSEAKAKRNLAKHGVNFETARQVFFDPHLLVLEDCEDSSGEMRYQAVGFAGAQLLLLVVFADRSTEEQETIRIISARKANDYEQNAYSDQF
ncbi:MAG: BrnT family toxin [Terriglobia bacterium]